MQNDEHIEYWSNPSDIALSVQGSLRWVVVDTHWLNLCFDFHPDDLSGQCVLQIASAIMPSVEGVNVYIADHKTATYKKGWQETRHD